MPELSVGDVQRNVGALVMQLWVAGKMVADLQQQVAAAKVDASTTPASAPRATAPNAGGPTPTNR